MKYCQSSDAVQQIAFNCALVRDVVVGSLLNVPATRECISGTDLLRQFYMLPH